MTTKLRWGTFGIMGLCLMLVGTSHAENAPLGSATNAIGTLTIVRIDGVQQRLQGTGALPLHEGDVLKTDGSSQALIKFGEGIEFAMNGDTTLMVLTRWERDKPTIRILRLKQGELWAKTSGGPKLFEVETPVASAAVKETEFNLKVEDDGQTILTVIEGMVQFGTAFNTWRVPRNSISYAARGKKCTKPAPTDVAPAAAWSAPVRP